MSFDRTIRVVQICGMLMGIPITLAGIYTVYRTFFTAEVACQQLRNSVLSTLERNIGAEMKRELVRRDVTEFEKRCGHLDPDARSIFLAAIDVTPDEIRAAQQAAQQSNALANNAPQPAPASQGATLSQVTTAPMASADNRPQSLPRQPLPGSFDVAIAAPASQGAQPTRSLPRPQSLPPAAPGLSGGNPPVQSGATFGVAALETPEMRRGWVALGRRDTRQYADANFDGYAISMSSLPPAGTLLTARWPVPVWPNPVEGRNDLKGALALMRPGRCARVVATRVGPDRLWAEVTPSACR